MNSKRKVQIVYACSKLNTLNLKCTGSVNIYCETAHTFLKSFNGNPASLLEYLDGIDENDL